MSGDREHGVLTNEELCQMGHRVWQITYAKTDDDTKILELLEEHADSLEDEVQGEILKMALKIPDEQLMTLWAARWRDQNFPRLVLDDRYAALLMATEATEETLAHLVVPWKAFMIQLSGQLLTTYCQRTGTEAVISRILVQTMKNQNQEIVWNFIAQGETGVQLWRHGMSPDALLCVAKDDVPGIWKETPFYTPIESKDERVFSLIGRLIISLCLAMSNPDNFHLQKTSKGRAKKLKLSGAGTIRTYVVGRPLTIDCRPAIRTYIDGSRSGTAPKVRFLVRGHWKRVVHGPKGSLRRMQQVMPYWKGSLEADLLREREVKLKNLKPKD